MKNSSGGPILLDVLAGQDEDFAVSFLERNQHPVLVCHGPVSGRLCPLLGEDGCSLYDAAHGVVFELDLDRPQHRAIVQRYRDRKPDIPIRVVARSGQSERYPNVFAGVQVWSHEPTAADLDGFAAEVEASDRYAQTIGPESEITETRAARDGAPTVSATLHHHPARLAVGIDGSVSSHLVRPAHVPVVIVSSPCQLRQRAASS